MLKYDDYAWQKDNNIKISEPWRAKFTFSIINVLIVI